MLYLSKSRSTNREFFEIDPLTKYAHIHRPRYLH